MLGLISGLNLPHFAVMAAAVAWVLIYVFDGHPVCSIEVQEVPKTSMKEAAAAYRQVLLAKGCRLISENKSFSKHRVSFVFRAPRNVTQAELHAALCSDVREDLRGELDWKVE